MLNSGDCVNRILQPVGLTNGSFSAIFQEFVSSYFINNVSFPDFYQNLKLFPSFDCFTSGRQCSVFDFVFKLINEFHLGINLSSLFEFRVCYSYFLENKFIKTDLENKFSLELVVKSPVANRRSVVTLTSLFDKFHDENSIIDRNPEDIVSDMFYKRVMTLPAILFVELNRSNAKVSTRYRKGYVKHCVRNPGSRRPPGALRAGAKLIKMLFLEPKLIKSTYFGAKTIKMKFLGAKTDKIVIFRSQNEKNDTLGAKNGQICNFSEQNGSEGLFSGVGGFILEAFSGSGRVLAPKCVLGGVLGGSWPILISNLVPT